MTDNTAAPAQAQAAPAKLVIDDKEYLFSELSDDARNQIVNLQGCDQEIARLRQQMAIVQTARMAYVAALKQALPQS